MTRKPKDRGHFSVVDLPTLRQWCLRYDADTVAILLCMAMGTDATGLLSSWTREPIRRRIPMSWRKIDEKLARVERDGGIVWQDKSSRRNRIRLNLHETRPMQAGFRAGLERAREGIAPATNREWEVMEQLCEVGWIDVDQRVIEDRKLEPAYLPLSLVGDERGMPTATPCILERIRRARDPLAFLLLAQMYAAQDLPENGGTAWDFICRAFAEEKVIYRTAETAILTASEPREWAYFTDLLKDHRPASGSDETGPYFDRIRILQDAGALEFVLSVVEDDQRGAQVIYPLGVLRQGKLDRSAPEHAVGLLATAAGLALSGDADELDDHLDQAPYSWRVPVDRMYRKAAIRGIPRLVARPRTSATARWHAERIELCRHWCEYFSGVIRDNAPEMLDQSGRLQCEFNETSTSLQCDLNDLPKSANHTAAGAARHDDEAA